MIKNCLICNKEFKTSHIKTKYCSKKCFYIDRKGVIPWNKGKKGLQIGFWKGKKLSKEHIEKMSKAKEMIYKGSGHPNWKGGRNKSMQGYVFIYNPEHPFCNKDGCVREHRIVMEKHLGRFLTSIEVVHHINNIRDDNRIENLQLFPNSGKHIKYHFHILRG